ncbi:MAG: hypothetical protein ACTTH5_02770 [Wolinella sp.]
MSDFADQILQLIQELKRLMKKPPTNKEEEDYFDNRFPAILEELSKAHDVWKENDVSTSLVELCYDKDMIDLAMELEKCPSSLDPRWLEFLLKLHEFCALAEKADGYETYFKISAQSLEEMHIVAKKIKTIAKAYDEKIATVEKHLEAVRN